MSSEAEFRKGLIDSYELAEDYALADAKFSNQQIGAELALMEEEHSA